MDTDIDNDLSEKVKKKSGICLKVVNNTNINDFTRAAYIDLFAADTPAEICEAKFEPAKTEVRNYTLVMCDYDISYSANLGFDRVEEYLATETYRGSDGLTHTRQVTKTRTVTDWQPTAGNYTGRKNAVCLEGSECTYAIQEHFGKCLLSDPKSNFVELDENDEELTPYVPTVAEETKAIKWGAEMTGSECARQLGGDQRKDYRYTYKANPKAVIGVVSKEYVLPVAMGEKSYAVESFSNKIEPLLKKPTDVTGYNISKSNDERAKKTRRILLFSTWGIFLLAFIACVVATQFTSYELFTVWATIPVVIFLACAVFTVIWIIQNKKAWSGISKKQTENANALRDKKKLECLTEKLSELKLAPLTNEEKAKFTNLDKLNSSNSYSGMEKFVMKLDGLFSKKNNIKQ